MRSRRVGLAPFQVRTITDVLTFGGGETAWYPTEAWFVKLHDRLKTLKARLSWTWEDHNTSVVYNLSVEVLLTRTVTDERLLAFPGPASEASATQWYYVGSGIGPVDQGVQQGAATIEVLFMNSKYGEPSKPGWNSALGLLELPILIRGTISDGGAAAHAVGISNYSVDVGSANISSSKVVRFNSNSPSPFSTTLYTASELPTPPNLQEFNDFQFQLVFDTSFTYSDFLGPVWPEDFESEVKLRNTTNLALI